MSYQVLARKYRPKNFHELVGQTHVSQALTNAIDQDRLHHAYLFTGTRGVGKTTIARILAKCLNCETGVTSTPCGTCSACTAIDAGRFIDLIEIDAASRTKVEDTRELLDNVPYAPSQGRYKVYLIDEVHMLSTHSFNALLKTLEEPPPHVKFLLATTDPQKLPITIISRCLQFVLRPLPRQAIFDHLVAILAQEHIDYEKPALWQLADAAKGSLRDALSLTDQAIGFGNRQVSLADVTTMLGSINTADLWALLKAIYQQDKANVSQTIEQLRMQLIDAKAILDAIAERLHQLALWQLLPELTFDLSADEQQQLAELGELMLPQSIQLYYEIVLQARDSLKMANTPMQGLEMCLLRLLAFQPFAAAEPDVTTTQLHEPVTGEKKNRKLSQTVNPAKSAELKCTTGHSNINETQPSNIQQPSTAAVISNSSTKIPTQIAAELETVKTPLIHSSHKTKPTVNSELLIVDDVLPKSKRVEPLLAESAHHQVSAQLADNAPPTPEQKQTKPTKTQPDTLQAFATADLPDVADNAVDITHDGEKYAVDGDSNAGTDTVPTSNRQQLAHVLACPKQVLAGEWTLDKWEYWVTHASLSNMERNLAMNGVMQGQINGAADFVVNVQYETVAKQRFSYLEARLIEDFNQIQPKLKLTHQPIDLPIDAVKNRQQQALQLAENMLLQEPIVQQLRQDFQARITDISLHDTSL